MQRLLLLAAGLAWLLALAPGLPGLSAVAQTPAPAEGTGAPSYQGRPLSEVLLSLGRQGLTVVFTSELVRPEMTVVAEPRTRDPRQVLDEVLAPHGLAVEEAANGVLVVVARGAVAGRPATIHGEVLAPGSREGVAGAVVRVVERGLEAPVDAAGSFSIATLEPGRYTLEAVAPGYLEQRIEDVAIAEGASRRIVFRLHPQPYVEDEIVVRPSRLSLLDEQPESSLSLGRAEIESLPHLAGDVFRATSLLPGVSANDVTAQFSIHGGRRDEVKLVLDGQELYGTFHLKDYDNALSLVSSHILAGAQLTTGAYPANQGDRMSGVLDLTTVEPSAGRQLVFGVSVLDLLASSSGRFAGDRGAWLATGRRGSLDLAADAIGAEDPRFWDAFGKATLTTGLGSFGARVLAAGDALGIDHTGSADFEHLANEYQNTYGWLSHQAGQRRLLVETIASWAGIDTEREGAGADEEGGHQLVDRRDLEVLSVSQAWTLEIASRHLARWGWEARDYEIAFDYAKVLDPDLVILAPFAPPRRTVHGLDGTLSGRHLGLWASDRVTWGERLTAELGVRYDRHTATDDTLLSPRVNLAWRLGERSVLRAAWGRFYQSQRPYELEVEDGESALSRAERSEHWVLGHETLLPANRPGLDALRIELFRREVDDPRPRYENLLEALNFFPEIEPDRVRIIPERHQSEGIELLLRGSSGARFDWWLAYSHARAKDRIAGREVPRSLDQPHTLNLALNYQLSKRWVLNLAWRYHTGWPTTPVEAVLLPPDPEDPEDPEVEAEPELVAVFGDLYSRRLPTYHRLDLRASRRWDRSWGRMTFYVDVQNVYNRENVAGFDVSLDEEAGLVMRDPENWPGVFPSFGITWEF